MKVKNSKSTTNTALKFNLLLIHELCRDYYYHTVIIMVVFQLQIKLNLNKGFL